MPRFLPLTFALISSACVTVYQPVAALQRPVTVDPSQKNFEGLNLLVRCVPSGDAADYGESEELCNNMSQLYSNQGAKVEIEIPDEEGGAGNRGDASDAEHQKPDLIMELRARRIHVDNSPILWMLCYASGTLIPSITEATFAQDVSIRDSDGFLLVSDTLQARFIRYFGLAFWAVNGLLDLIVRPKGEGLIGNNHKYDFSRDFHNQMSQLVFHATMREKVLRSFEGEPVITPAAAPAQPLPGAPAMQPPPQPRAPQQPPPPRRQPPPQTPPPPVLPP